MLSWTLALLTCCFWTCSFVCHQLQLSRHSNCLEVMELKVARFPYALILLPRLVNRSSLYKSCVKQAWPLWYKTIDCSHVLKTVSVRIPSDVCVSSVVVVERTMKTYLGTPLLWVAGKIPLCVCWQI